MIRLLLVLFTVVFGALLAESLYDSAQKFAVKRHQALQSEL